MVPCLDDLVSDIGDHTLNLDGLRGGIVELREGRQKRNGELVELEDSQVTCQHRLMVERQRRHWGIQAGGIGGDSVVFPFDALG
ncbi:hypothetical protein WS68_23980 [Burkholderia sp. TSV86]|nr:hypothetical protein WS68_23980 [Burkholderia sp. TSV86]